jgi:hypothetical protein
MYVASVAINSKVFAISSEVPYLPIGVISSVCFLRAASCSLVKSDLFPISVSTPPGLNFFVEIEKMVIL